MFIRSLARLLVVVVFVALIVLLFVAPAVLSDGSKRVRRDPPSKRAGAAIVPLAAVPERLAECLTRKGTVLYTAWWCSSCKKQEALFGADASKLTLFQCSPPDDYVLLESCATRGITSAPTWIRADGDMLIGIQSLGTLATWSGCANTP